MQSLEYDMNKIKSYLNEKLKTFKNSLNDYKMAILNLFDKIEPLITEDALKIHLHETLQEINRKV